MSYATTRVVMPSASRHPAIGQEFIPSTEPSDIEQLATIHQSIQEEKDRLQRPVPRNVHPKQHGILRAEFTIDRDLPDALRHGLFAAPRTLSAIVRFSNGKQHNDQLPDAHGLAVKLLGVEGEQSLPHGATTQDFVAIDHPVFFVKTVADFIPLMRDFRRLMVGGPLAKARTVFKATFSRDYRYRLLRQTVAKRPSSPVTIQYWSTTPYKLGGGAMKFLFRPHIGATGYSGPKSADKLRLALSAQLKQGDVAFDFLVQIQTDPVAMPVENPTVEWKSLKSPWRKVATLRIPPQTFESAEQMEWGNALSFSPWHALAAHRPLGGINRARRRIYEVMSARRRELNGVSILEPTLSEVEEAWSRFRGMGSPPS